MLAKGPDSSIFIKKLEKEPAKDADEDGYTPISTNGGKKAKKMYDGAVKKLAKQSEMASKAQVSEGNEERRLEESRQVVLEEPKGFYKKVRRDRHHEFAEKTTDPPFPPCRSSLDKVSTIGISTSRYKAGFIDCVSKRASSSLFFEMGQVSCNVS